MKPSLTKILFALLVSAASGSFEISPLAHQRALKGSKDSTSDTSKTGSLRLKGLKAMKIEGKTSKKNSMRTKIQNTGSLPKTTKSPKSTKSPQKSKRSPKSTEIIKSAKRTKAKTTKLSKGTDVKITSSRKADKMSKNVMPKNKTTRTKSKRNSKVALPKKKTSKSNKSKTTKSTNMVI